MAAVSVDEQRAYIKIEYLRGKTGKEIADNLQEACGDSAVSFKTVYRWIARFKSGNLDILDEPHTGRIPSSTGTFYVEKVKELIDTDRRYTCEEIASHVGISSGSAHTILTRCLKMRKIAARWVPHFLNDVQMLERLNSAKELLTRYEKEGESFLNRIVAIDETWMRSYEPELKSQSAQWHTPSSPRPAKFRRKQGGIKMLAIFAYDNAGILSAHFVPTGQTVNGLYYKHFLQEILRPAIRKKRRHLLEAGPLLLHDNATPHKSAHVTSLIDQYGWETLRHPPYSPDLSPCDFDLFPKLKLPMRGTRFNDLEDLKDAVATQVRRINSGCLATGIAGLPGRWKSVISHRGRYIEGF
jgi:histone-lysine N-methyltransferase SETMAR